MRSKVKVSVDELTKALEAKRAKIVAEHEKRKKQYEEYLASGAIQKALKAAADDGLGEIGNMHYRGKYRAVVIVPLKGRVPVEPEAAPNIGSLDKALTMLKMASEPTIAISAEDYGRYLD